MLRGFAATSRMTLLAVGVLTCFLGVGVRLVFLHVLDRDELLRYVEKARRQLTVEQARRGAIVDSRGNILATSRSEITVAVDPWALVEYLESDKNELRRAEKRGREQGKQAQLAAILGLPTTEVASAFAPGTRPSRTNDPAAAVTDGRVKVRWVKLKEGVDEPTYDRIADLDLKGLTCERVYRRVYPGRQLASHILGYVNREGAPVTGAEHNFDLYLRGQDGWIESEKDGARRELAQFRSREVPVQDGNTVVLTIDSVVQNIIEEELRRVATAFNPRFATIIVSDPKTGSLLGMANYPSYDPNEFNKAPLDAQRNCAVTDIVEPGSTFKIVAASGALNEGLVTPASTFDCGSDTAIYRGRPLKLMKEDHQFGMLTLAEVISHSSNRGAARLGMLLGEDRLYDYARRFGFGQRTGFELGGEVGGILASPRSWDGLTITRMPAGHAVAATPLQIHCAMSSLASHGMRFRPRIIKEVRDPRGQVLLRFNPEPVEQAVSPAVAAEMARMLRGVVSPGGTAAEAEIMGFELAGKTGTTQKLVDGRYVNNRHVASFTGFFPASHPEVALTVIVDDAKVAAADGGAAYGRVVAAPAFRHIAEQLIQYLDIKPALPPASGFLARNGGGR